MGLLRKEQAEQLSTSKSYLVGVNHAFNKPVTIVPQRTDATELLLQADGTINGFESVKTLEKHRVITRSTLISALVLTPLCGNSFNYSLATFPHGQVTHKELYDIFVLIRQISYEQGLTIIALVGDGDTRLRKLQYGIYLYVPNQLTWLEKTEFPISLAYGIDFKNDISMQDILHVLKKLRNNIKYLSSKLLLMCSPSRLNTQDRYTYVVRWDVITHCWQNVEQFKDLVTKSCACLSDKQDPSLVTELSFSYLILYELGYKAMGLYIEMIYLLFSAFYDKCLKPEDRITNVSIVKAVMTLWREELRKRKLLGKHFITKPSFDDMICSIDGLIMYTILLSTEFPEAELTPWFLTSDSCEQLFAFLRTGQHSGRRTNLTALAVILGMAKWNRTLTLDEEGLHMLGHTIAHTRGRSLHSQQDMKNTYPVFKGKDISISMIKTAIEEGALIGRKKFTNNTAFRDNESDSQDAEDDDDQWCDEDSDGDDGEDSDSNCEAAFESDDLWEFSDGKKYHPKTAAEKYLNDGRSRNPAQTRFKRFRVIHPNRLSLRMRCSANDGCVCLNVGQSGWFIQGGGSGTGRGRRKLVRGQAIFIILPLSTGMGASADRSSISYDPIDAICLKHQSGYIWVKQVNGKLTLCCGFKSVT